MPSRHGHDTRYSRKHANDGRSNLDDGRYAAEPRKMMRELRDSQKNLHRLIAKSDKRHTDNRGGSRRRRRGSRRTRRHH
jgi:hypothetical protein